VGAGADLSRGHGCGTLTLPALRMRSVEILAPACLKRIYVQGLETDEQR
jgi:hypothetical protein